LNRANFQKWSLTVKIALKTKTKLGFIDGSCAKPAVTSHLYDQWIRCDIERFGQSNGPLLSQLEKELSELYQENDSVAVCYTKMKGLCDELDDLSEIPVCAYAPSCKAIKKTMALAERQKLMHFLMHLNENYEAIRG